MKYNKEEIREEFKDLFEHSLDFIYVHDLRGNFLDANDIALKTLGYEREEIPNLNFASLIDKDQLKKAITLTNEIINSGRQTVPGEYKLKTKDGNDVYVEAYGMPLKKNGKIYAILGVGHNITERKLSEKILKASEQQFREYYNHANFFKDLLTHDMNNILQSILTSTEICLYNINEPGQIEEIKKTLEIIKEQVNRGANLTTNVQELSRLDENTPIKKTIDVCELLRNAINFLKESFPKKEINVQIDSMSNQIQINANELLRDVFDNILSNAVKYTENPKVEIQIKILKEQRDNIDYLKMEFLDNGIGIQDSRKNLVFKRVYKGQKSTKGLGLGLSIVRIIIEGYNGHIWVEDKVKGDHTKGSNFVILIPEN